MRACGAFFVAAIADQPASYAGSRQDHGRYIQGQGTLFR